MHWDKDYAMEDQGLNLCPHIATVTYLTNHGGPTIILDKMAPLPYGEDLEGEIPECCMSLPKMGKHISFDGKLLHAAPSELRSLWKPSSSGNSSGSSKEERKRVSFLVNIWLNHKPGNAEPLDDDTAAKMGEGMKIPFGSSSSSSSSSNPGSSSPTTTTVKVVDTTTTPLALPTTAFIVALPPSTTAADVISTTTTSTATAGGAVLGGEDGGNGGGSGALPTDGIEGW